jgi:hypothetical protein
MALRRRRPVLPAQRDTDPAHAMVLRAVVEELRKEWFRR